ncbi:MAG TPA: hypothetical protein VGR45_00685 [Stellaceae bacterium]|nr:hypothetical protein [Stellaceae bacterium]
MRVLAGEARWRLLIPAGSQMRINRGFDPIGPDEQDDFAFDFGPLLTAFGIAPETIASTAWVCSVSEGSAAADASAATRLIGSPSIVGTLSVQRIGTMVTGVSYTLEATIVTALSGRALSLCAGIDCKSC